MGKTNPNIWTTNDGQKLEIKWMTSPHLAHAVNLMVRKNQMSRQDVTGYIAKHSIPFTTMCKELQARGLFSWTDGSSQIVVPPHRETVSEMCMLRALIDCRAGTERIVAFAQNTGPFMEQIRALPDAVIHKFTEYRLARS